MTPTELAYRKTAVEGATGFGLLVGLYDTLAGDLRRAADAERNNQIEARCKELNHAFLVIAYLEDWLQRGSGGQLARELAAFYSSLRRNLIKAQAARSAAMIEEQMALVLKVRGTWQQFEGRGQSTPAAAAHGHISGYPGAPTMQADRSASSWSA